MFMAVATAAAASSAEVGPLRPPQPARVVRVVRRRVHREDLDQCPFQDVTVESLFHSRRRDVSSPPHSIRIFTPVPSAGHLHSRRSQKTVLESSVSLTLFHSGRGRESCSSTFLRMERREGLTARRARQQEGSLGQASD